MLVLSKERQQTTEKYLHEVRRFQTHNSRDCQGIPTLCLAIDEFRSSWLVEELLKDGAEVNATSCLKQPGLLCGTTRDRCLRWGNFAPIHLAVALGLPKVVKLLIEYGADLKSKTAKGVETKDFLLNDFQARCLEKGKRISESDDYDILLLLHAAGVDLNTNGKRFRQNTLLHRAVACNNHQITKYLIYHGADVNSADIDGKTPLHVCCTFECAKIVLENNADINAPDNCGNTIYHYADKFNCPTKFLSLLHDFCINPNVRNNNGQTALHILFENVSLDAEGAEMIESILKYGADPNIGDKLERTPTYYLISKNLTSSNPDSWKIAWSLLVRCLGFGVQLNRIDITGQPLIHQLVEYCLLCPKCFDKRAFTKVLHPRNSVEVNFQDIYNRTVLHLVAAKGDWKIGNVLIKNGADVEIEDCDGNTPLDVAILCKQWAFAKELLCLPSVNKFIIDNSSCNGHVYLRGKLKAINQLTQIRQCKSAKDLSHQRSDINLRRLKENSCHQYCSSYDLYQNPTENLKPIRCRVSNGTEFRKPDRPRAVAAEQTTVWTTDTLHAIAEYAERGLISLVGAERKNQFFETFLCPVPTISSYISTKINKSSLLELCEKNCVGEFHLVEQCEDEHCSILKQVFRLVSDLVEKCSEMDARLHCKLLWAGSSAEGTKMWLPDEFDFMMELTELEGHCELANRNWTSPSIKISEECQECWSNLCLDSCTMASERLKIYITTLLWKAAFQLDRSKYENITFKLCDYDKNLNAFIQTTKVGVQLTVFWFGVKYKKLLVSIDLTPAIPVLLSKEQLSNLRQRNGAKRLIDNRLHVVPCVNKRDADYWRLSFSVMEVRIMRNLPRDQIALYKTLKFFRDIHKSLFADIPSYHLKTLLFNSLFLECNALHRHCSFNSRLRIVLERLNRQACSEDNNGGIQHFFLKSFLPVKDYDMRWVKSTLDILENCD